MFTLSVVFTNTHGPVPLCYIMFCSVFYPVFTLSFVLTNAHNSRYMILVYINDADNSGWSSRLASDVKTGIVIETEAPTVAIPLHVTILSVRLHPSIEAAHISLR
jgi:hypothetical protein